MLQSDLAARLRWHVDHDRAELVDLLAEAVPVSILRDAVTVSSTDTTSG